ncbi:MAG: hypothetical protein AAGE84_12285 [Cyanobacteria bacterium P01_G01_bin.39]
MNINSVNDESIFQSAIAAVEALSLAEQAVLIDIIQNRLQQKHSEIKEKIKEVTHNNEINNSELVSIDDFLAELEL